MTDNLAPGLWTADEIVQIYQRLLQWCADHPDESTPRLEQLYRDRLAKHEQLAVEEKAARLARINRSEPVVDPLADPNAAHRQETASRVHPLIQTILDTTYLAYGVGIKGRR